MKNPRDLRFEKFRDFKRVHGSVDFSSKKLCNEYMRLKMDWWGSNLVPAGMKEENKKFSPHWNVFN